MTGASTGIILSQNSGGFHTVNGVSIGRIDPGVTGKTLSLSSILCIYVTE